MSFSSTFLLRGSKSSSPTLKISRFSLIRPRIESVSFKSATYMARSVVWNVAQRNFASMKNEDDIFSPRQKSGKKKKGGDPFSNFSKVGADFEKGLEKNPMFSKMMKDLERDMDKKAQKTWREDVAKTSHQAPKKSFEEALADFKESLHNEEKSMPQMRVVPNPQWKIEEGMNENEEEIATLSRRIGKHEVQISFPLEVEEQTEGEEGEDSLESEKYEEMFSQQKESDLKMSHSDPKVLSEGDRSLVAEKSKRHTANVEIIFFDPQGLRKGSLLMQCSVEEDDNFYIQNISIRSKTKQDSPELEAEKLSMQFQSALYALLSSLNIDAQVGGFIKNYIQANSVKKYTEFLNQSLKLAE